MALQDLKNAAQAIKDQTKIFGNSHTIIGDLLLQILDIIIESGSLTQVTGNSTTKIMSQKAVTQLIAALQLSVTNLDKAIVIEETTSYIKAPDGFGGVWKLGIDVTAGANASYISYTDPDTHEVTKNFLVTKKYVDDQIAQIGADLNFFDELLKKDIFTNGYYIDDRGIERTDARYSSVLDYLSCKGATNILIVNYRPNPVDVYLSFYDASKAQVGRYLFDSIGYGKTFIDVPSNAIYYRYTTDINYTKISGSIIDIQGLSEKISKIDLINSGLTSLESKTYPFEAYQRNILNSSLDNNFDASLTQAFSKQINPINNNIEKYALTLTLTSLGVYPNWIYYYTKSFGVKNAGNYTAFIKLKSNKIGADCELTVFTTGGAFVASKTINTSNDYKLYAIEFNLTGSTAIHVGISAKTNTPNVSVGDTFDISIIGLSSDRSENNYADNIYTIDDLKFLINSAFSIDTVDNRINIKSNPLETIKETPGFTNIFHSWGFIGDSLTSGEHEYTKEDTSDGLLDLYEYSWGQRLCAACGATGYNFSRGGQTTKGWINDASERGWGGAQTNLKQAYIIALGTNDYNGLTVGNTSTDINLSDYTLNADTFAGNYAGIIQRIKSLQPKAIIFVSTLCYEGSDREAYNNVIRSMPTIFENVYLIDIYTYAPKFIDDWSSRYRLGYHLNAMGYQWEAWMYMTYIDWIIRNNYSKFKQVAFIGTNYSHN